MRKLLVVALVLMGSATAFGQTASYSWEFEGGGTVADLPNVGDMAVIDVFVTIDVDFAGWHYDLDATYPGIRGFDMTDLWVMPEADRYNGLVVPDIADYSSFADMLDQGGGQYWLSAGTHLIEKLTITATNSAAAGEIAFAPEAGGAGFNILWKDPGDGIQLVPGVTVPGPLTVIPEPASFALLALGGLVLIRRR